MSGIYVQGNMHSQIHRILFDPSPAGAEERKMMQTICAITKIACGLIGFGSISAAACGIVLLPSYPILGSLVLLSGSGISLLALDVSIVANNLYNMCSQWVPALQASFAGRLRCAETILKGTYVVGPIGKEALVQFLDLPQA